MRTVKNVSEQELRCSTSKSLGSIELIDIKQSMHSFGILFYFVLFVCIGFLFLSYPNRSLQEFYLTNRMNIYNSQGFYQKASVDSERTEEQLT